MSYISERVAFIKGLAEGMNINDSTNEGKLLNAIIDVLDDISLAIEDVEEIQDEIGEQVDGIDEDLAELEKIMYEDEDEDELEFEEIECPYCGEEIEVDLEMIDEDAEAIECPHCHEKIELEWDCECDEEGCGCDCGCEHDHDKE